MVQEKHYKQPYTFDKGPAIEAYFTIQDQFIQSVSLTLSSTPGLKCFISKGSDLSIEEAIHESLLAYSQKLLPVFSLPLDWTSVTPFTHQVLQKVKAIPLGSTLSYKEVAQALGKDQASRAVGGACGRNPFLLIIPCHRVLAVGNRLGGFSGGIEIKKRLLAFEQHPFM